MYDNMHPIAEAVLLSSTYNLEQVMSSGLMIHVEVSNVLQDNNPKGTSSAGSPVRSAFQVHMQIDCYQERPDECGSLGKVHYILEAMEDAENLLCTTFNGFKVC